MCRVGKAVMTVDGRMKPFDIMSISPDAAWQIEGRLSGVSCSIDMESQKPGSASSCKRREARHDAQCTRYETLNEWRPSQEREYSRSAPKPDRKKFIIPPRKEEKTVGRTGRGIKAEIKKKRSRKCFGKRYSQRPMAARAINPRSGTNFKVP